ncbi:N-acetyl-gamma-glutamyl-phosphate reductase [Sphingomonas sp.]|uniref:N-acetyl-gamma-glutamyl-phosphate reductase n=1 Tax=Sphingomonas sp. TaxID=28214 RepID=UPI00286B1F4A|nr:N-acetyl-gamma-glutamyl-phosphate reductase [Sphingomonas sp.]
MTCAAILGASGYVGGELLRLLAAHPGIQAGSLFASSNAGQLVEAVHPHLALAYPGRTFAAYAPGALAGADLVFAALPHGETQKLADDFLACGAKIVDLGADFRLDSADEYERWYGESHTRPDLLGEFVYGLPEFHREAIRAAHYVAAPGCYPTAATLALRPLIDAGLASRDGLIIDAASGVSGAGRAANAGTHYCAVEGSLRAYGLLGHRHTAEMKLMLGGEPLFTPHLAPMSRGILATCYATATGSGDPLVALRDAYADEPFVHVGTVPPETKWASGSNAAFVAARHDDRTGRIVAIAAIDNLGKGAAGQMIQCANLMLGLDEGAGLANCGIYP